MIFSLGISYSLNLNEVDPTLAINTFIVCMASSETARIVTVCLGCRKKGLSRVMVPCVLCPKERAHDQRRGRYAALRGKAGPSRRESESRARRIGCADGAERDGQDHAHGRYGRGSIAAKRLPRNRRQTPPRFDRRGTGNPQEGGVSRGSTLASQQPHGQGVLAV